MSQLTTIVAAARNAGVTSGIAVALACAQGNYSVLQAGDFSADDKVSPEARSACARFRVMAPQERRPFGVALGRGHGHEDTIWPKFGRQTAVLY
jgi:hypothetical protein